VFELRLERCVVTIFVCDSASRI